MRNRNLKNSDITSVTLAVSIGLAIAASVSNEYLGFNITYLDWFIASLIFSTISLWFKYKQLQKNAA